MHCALKKGTVESQKILEAGQNFSSKKVREENNIKTSVKESKVSSLARRNPSSRCVILAFLTPVSDGTWRTVAPPFPCLSYTISASGINMDGLQLILPQPINTLKIGRHKGHRGPPPDFYYSFNTFTAGTITGTNVRHQARNKTWANRASKLNELSGKTSNQSLLTCNNSSVRTGNSTASDIFINSSIIDKRGKKNSGKKARKKGRQSKKVLGDTISPEPEVLSEECAQGSSSETCGNNDGDNGNVLMPYSNGTEFAPSDSRSIKYYSNEGNNNEGIIKTLESPKACIPCTNEVDNAEARAPMLQNSIEAFVLCNSEGQLQTKSSDLLNFSGGMRDARHLQRCCSSDMYTKDFSNVEESLVIDSVSVDSKSGGSTNGIQDVRQPETVSCELGLLEVPSPNPREEYHRSQNSLEVGGDNHHPKGTKHVGKRGKASRTFPKSSCVNKFGGIGKSHGHSGKENNHSVWQKVQRNNFDECSGELKNKNSTSQLDSALKKAPLKRNSDIVVHVLSKVDDKKHLKDKVGRKLKRKTSTASKQQDQNCYSRKGSSSSMVISNDHTKVSMQENGVSYILPQPSDQHTVNDVVGSHSQFNCPAVGLQTPNRAESKTSESFIEECFGYNETGPLESFCNDTIIGTNNQGVETCDSLFSRSCEVNESKMAEEQSAVSLSQNSGDDLGQIQKDGSFSDCNKQNPTSGSTLKRWIPIGIKDSQMEISTGPDGSPLQNFDGLASNDSKQNGVVQISRSSYCSCSRDHQYQYLQNLDTDMPKEQSAQFSARANCFIYESENQVCLEGDADKIAQAVKHACAAELACEEVQMATGGPIAEYERVLHLCSPVICQTSDSANWLTCLSEHAHGVPLCRLLTPNISLGCLWEWYEKHGSYGLEIRAEDCENPKRMGFDRFAFRAYFVPHLSAIQLFSNCKSQNVHSSENSFNPEALDSYTEEISSCESQVPVFSLPFHQSIRKDGSSPAAVNEMCCSEVSSSAGEDNSSNHSADTACFGDSELLFEYFESDQPQQRPPLYEKIKELVSDNRPSRSTVYGDPTILNSVNLRDLHPGSWYSVAWYPIYRIPDGNLRAAFLTFHSLGHLVRRSNKIDSSRVDTCVVSPVVGLQSYNAQSECWFQLKQSVVSETADIPGSNPSGILKERLQALEETASLMARAVVNKGNRSSVNRHPDYEFFLSRRRQ